MGWYVTQCQSACLAYMKPWVLSPVPKKIKEKKMSTIPPANKKKEKNRATQEVEILINITKQL